MGLGLLIIGLRVFASDYPIVVRGADEASYTPQNLRPGIVKSKESYDTVIVGSGLAGLSAAVYLTDNGQRVLLLEKESELGGLAAGGVAKGSAFGRGAAYWTRAYEEEFEILKHIGLSEYEKRYPITEPIDSYLWDGHLYLGIWEEETLKELPASFALFKHELEFADKDGLIPNQPFEMQDNLDLDSLDGTSWIRQMPLQTAKREDEESKAIWERFQKDPKIDRNDPMGDVIGLMNQYTRSALGTTPDKVSAVAFANFYISELEIRYTTETGTGGAAEHMVEMLLKRNKLAKLTTRATVTRMESRKQSVKVRYVQDNVIHEATAKYGVFAGALRLAPKIILGFKEKEQKRTEILNRLQYAHYSVHNVHVKGHPYRATYDTWTKMPDGTLSDFSDLILGRWMDPKIRGYEGMRDFKKDPDDDEGVLSIYHPLSLDEVGRGFTESRARALAEDAVTKMVKWFGPLLHDHWGTKIEIRSVETNRWPYSIHVAAPGHFSHDAELLRKPYGRIFFANNNIGTPAFEEALFRGHCAANNILSRRNKTFKNESWSRCPID